MESRSPGYAGRHPGKTLQQIAPRGSTKWDTRAEGRAKHHGCSVLFYDTALRSLHFVKLDMDGQGVC